MVRRLSHYELVEEISRGGMGIVYRAVDVNLGREVAIKVLPDAIAHDSDRRTRLLHEARAASTLEHPHIAVIHEVGEDNGVTFIAMELIRGEKLSDVLRRGPLPMSRALALAVEIAEGLARAHDKGIVHRDLKPANVMVTDDGHAKVIDFGLVKVVETVDPGAATMSVGGPRTESGLVLGTASYMSPEQARGARVDHRSDIFALGVTVYEMLTGRPAFQGESSLDTMRAILAQPVPPLPATDAPADATAEVQRIINKCTAKDPEDRFQGMKDLVVDLRAAKRRLESAPSMAVTAAGPTPVAQKRAPVRMSRRWIAAAAMAVVALAAVALWWTSRHKAAPAGASGKQAVAVLYFENNTGDQTLDWMRTGLTDMLVTDLSQSSDIEVVGTDRVVQILQEMRRADDRVLSADVVQAVADRAHVDQVVLGSYIKAGDTIRISARLQDARSGRIVKAERVEGPGPNAVFQLVDELTRRLKATMMPARASGAGSLLLRPGGASEEAGLDRGVHEITTSSIEAYRFYAEGLNFHDRGLSEQAVPLFEKAIEIDPDFAMALAKLAVVNWNMRLFDKSEEYAKRALSHVDRLTTRERYYIEGFYYGLHTETLSKSINAYKQELAIHPEHQSSRHNLGLTYSQIELYDDARAEYEELLRRGSSTPTTYENLADIYIRTGNTGRARELAEELVSKQPDNAIGFRTLANALVAEGRLDEARAPYDKAIALDPLGLPPVVGKRNLSLLQERWTDFDEILQDLGHSQRPVPHYLALTGAAQRAALRGRDEEAVSTYERAARAAGLSSAQKASARNSAALLLIRQEKPAAALAEAQQALQDARGLDQEFETLRLLAVAQAASNRAADAQKTLAILESRAQLIPSDREKRRVLWARGLVALASGEKTAAADQITKAAAMLPAHGPVVGAFSSHADLWYDAAWTNIQTGRDPDAARWLERLQSSYERVYGLDAYARSFFLLAQIYERRGDSARAQQQYARFLDFWGDGDVERGWVNEARKKVGRKTVPLR